MRKNIAIILAAGVGSRTGLKKPKQFFKLAGKPVIAHTIEVFNKHKEIDEIAIVSQSEYFDTVRQIISENSFNKCKKVLLGGKERYHSTLSALTAYKDEGEVNLIIHDSVRPLLSSSVISDCIKALESYSAVDVAIPNDDTIIEVENNCLYDIPVRDRFWRGQTPQCFHLDVLQKAYDIALKDPNFKTTDDCKIVHTYCPDVKTTIVEGAKSNMKLTHIEDLHMLENFFQLRQETLSDSQKTSLEQLKDKTMVVFGGTSGIGEGIATYAKSMGANVHAFGRSNKVNITDPASVQNALRAVKSPIDAVIVTAGVLKIEPIHTMDYEDIIDAVNTNYVGSIICAKESYKYLKETSGMLLFFSSSSYTKGRSFYATYSSSKAAIVNLTQALSEEWYNDNIRVNCINPERTASPMRSKAFGYEDPKTLLGAEKVAIATLNTLFSDISGQIISVKK